MSKDEAGAETAGKSKITTKPLDFKDRLLIDVAAFEGNFQNAIANAEVMVAQGLGSFEQCLQTSLLCDVDLRVSLPDKIYAARLSVHRLTKAHQLIRGFILETEQRRPLPRRGKNWRKIKPRNERVN